MSTAPCSCRRAGRSRDSPHTDTARREERALEPVVGFFLRFDKCIAPNHFWIGEARLREAIKRTIAPMGHDELFGPTLAEHEALALVVGFSTAVLAI
jgi:hypothetical protein